MCARRSGWDRSGFTTMRDVLRGAAALAVLVAAVACLGQETGPRVEALKVGSTYAGKGALAEGLKDGEKAVTLKAAGGVTVTLELSGSFVLRVDRAVRAGKDAAKLFPKGMAAAVFGRPSRMTNAPGAGFRSHVVPLVLVLGEGFEPKDAAPPPSSAAFGGEPRWIAAPVDRFEAPDGLWIGLNGDCHVQVGPADRVLTTALHDGAKLVSAPELRRLLAKGQPVRFSGKVTEAALVDSKGAPVTAEAARGKLGVRTTLRVAPKRLALLDAGFSYEAIEKAESN